MRDKHKDLLGLDLNKPVEQPLFWIVLFFLIAVVSVLVSVRQAPSPEKLEIPPASSGVSKESRSSLSEAEKEKMLSDLNDPHAPLTSSEKRAILDDLRKRGSPLSEEQKQRILEDLTR